MFAQAGEVFSASPCRGVLWLGRGSGWLLAEAAVGASPIPLESLEDWGWDLPCLSSSFMVGLSLQPSHR